MTGIVHQCDWDEHIPDPVMLVVVVAAEQAAHGRADAASLVIVDADAPAAVLRVAAVRTLAGLVAGPYAGPVLDKLRADAHAVAAETGAEDERVRLALEALAEAGAYERGQRGRLYTLESACEFTHLDVALAAAVAAGHVIAAQAGDRLDEVFAALRRRYGGEA